MHCRFASPVDFDTVAGFERNFVSNPLNEIRNIRIGKADEMRQQGLNPYPSKSGRTHYAKAVLDGFEALNGQMVTVAGRLMSWRKQGALAFGHVQDQSGRIQLFLRKQAVKVKEEGAGNIGFTEFNLLDLGDIVEATGLVKKTERGEISVFVETFRILTKTIRPLPDQWSGLKDREQILRKRYLDVILSPESQERFASVCRMIAEIRVFMKSRGFLEFVTPVIQPQYGGGTAKPFKTHVNALNCDMYLAISHELYLKRLIAAGYDKVYTIGRYFRNEGIDRSHHPEFSMVESMTAYENYEYNMNLIEDMFRHIAKEAFGKTQFNVKGHVVDFEKPWTRISMADAVKNKFGVDFRKVASVDEANEFLKKFGLAEIQASVGEAMVAAFELVEPDLIQPTLVFGHPIEISPLAKPMAEDPRYVERFEIFIAGMECGDNWSEQNDPVQLLQTWRKAYKPEERDSGEFHALDFDFIEALEYGIPPTTGIGPGVERMAMIFTEQENIDDVIFFPLMRPSISPFNAAIYGIDEHPLAPVEDLAITIEEAKGLIDTTALSPIGDRLTVKPHVRIWTVDKKVRVTGHAEVEGFARQGLVHIAGYSRVLENSFKLDAELELFKTFLEKELGAALKAKFPNAALHFVMPALDE
jgi:lysyl-tRNA synthetase, class II